MPWLSVLYQATMPWPYSSIANNKVGKMAGHWAMVSTVELARLDSCKRCLHLLATVSRFLSLARTPATL